MTSRSRSAPLNRSKILPARPFVVIGLVYLAAMLLSTILRGLFLAGYSDLVAEESLSEIITAFLVGMRFDQIIVLAVLTPALLALPWVGLRSGRLRKVLVGYLAVMFSLTTILLLVDIRFYNFFDSRLNFLAVEYIADGSMFGNLMVTDPDFYPTVFVWLTLTAILVAVLILIMRRTTTIPHRRSWPNQLVYFVLFLVLFALGIRGRISMAPMDWGVAYFSHNHFLNQLALNGVYTLGRNLTETNREPRLSYLSDNERFPLVPFDEALRTTREMIGTDSDQWLDDSTLWRLSRQPQASYGFQPNVVVILSESWSAELTGAFGDPRNLTPNFDRLAKSGVMFSNFYASGTRTNFGIGAVLCSFPAIPGRAIMKRFNANHPFRSLSEILRERGYNNTFIYGGDLAFDNMEGFLRQKGFDRFYGQDDFDRALYFSKWGIPDHVLFERTARILDSLPRPFQVTVLTLSNHEPWDLPDSSVQVYFDDADSCKVFNSQVYADYALGRFLDLTESSRVADSTIFVFVSDHGRYGPSAKIIEPRFFHIPLLISAPTLLGDRAVRISACGSQTDILPTVMGLLGGDYRHSSWGHDLLNLPPGDSGFAVMNLGTRTAYIDRNFLYTENLTGVSGFGTRGMASSGLQWFGHSYFESLDVLGKRPDDSSWVSLYTNVFRGPTLFATRHVLGRLKYLDEGFIYVQEVGGRADSTDLNETTRWQAVFGESEPQGLKRSRRRLRHFMQAAEQLSTPVEP